MSSLLGSFSIFSRPPAPGGRTLSWRVHAGPFTSCGCVVGRVQHYHRLPCRQRDVLSGRPFRPPGPCVHATAALLEGCMQPDYYRHCRSFVTLYYCRPKLCCSFPPVVLRLCKPRENTLTVRHACNGLDIWVMPGIHMTQCKQKYSRESQSKNPHTRETLGRVHRALPLPHLYPYVFWCCSRVL